MESIRRWKDRCVRLKREYLEKVKDIDEDASTYDDDTGELIEAVYVEYYRTINMHNGFEGCLIKDFDLYTATFKVRAEIYGIDLYRVQDKTLLKDLPEPSHQIFIEETGNWPFMWDSKYFEVVKRQDVWVKDEDY